MFDPWVGKISWRGRGWLSTPVFLPGEFQGQKSLVGYSPWGCKELDMTEKLTLSLTYAYIDAYICVVFNSYEIAMILKI